MDFSISSASIHRCKQPGGEPDVGKDIKVIAGSVFVCRKEC